MSQKSCTLWRFVTDLGSEKYMTPSFVLERLNLAQWFNFGKGRFWGFWLTRRHSRETDFPILVKADNVWHTTPKFGMVTHPGEGKVLWVDHQVQTVSYNKYLADVDNYR